MTLFKIPLGVFVTQLLAIPGNRWIEIHECANCGHLTRYVMKRDPDTCEPVVINWHWPMSTEGIDSMPWSRGVQVMPSNASHVLQPICLRNVWMCYLTTVAKYVVHTFWKYAFLTVIKNNEVLLADYFICASCVVRCSVAHICVSSRFYFLNESSDISRLRHTQLPLIVKVASAQILNLGINKLSTNKICQVTGRSYYLKWYYTDLDYICICIP